MTALQFKSLEDLHGYTQEVAARRPEDNPKVQKLQKAKQAVWLTLLAGTFLLYYLIDKMGEALAML